MLEVLPGAVPDCESPNLRRSETSKPKSGKSLPRSNTLISGSRQVLWLHEKHQGQGVPLRKATRSWKDWLHGTRTGQMSFMFCIAMITIFLGACAWRQVGPTETYDTSWWHSYCISYFLFIDVGTQTGLSPDESGPMLSMSILLSCMGFLFNLTLFGILADGVRAVLARWKKEHSMIVWNGHTVVLGWTDKTLFLLRERLDAAENMGLRRQSIVVLADRDELEMMNDVKDYMADKLRVHRVRCWRGVPCNPNDLLRVSIASARDIIVLGAVGSPHESDVEVMRIMVAMGCMQEQVAGRLIAEVRCSETVPKVEALLENAAGVPARCAINHLMCLMAIKPSLGICFTSLCSYETGVEFYAVNADNVPCTTFAEVRQHLTESLCIGIKPPDQNILIAPADDYVIGGNDVLVVLADDRGKIYQRDQTFSERLVDSAETVRLFQPSDVAHVVTRTFGSLAEGSIEPARVLLSEQNGSHSLDSQDEQIRRVWSTDSMDKPLQDPHLYLPAEGPCALPQLDKQRTGRSENGESAGMPVLPPSLQPCQEEVSHANEIIIIAGWPNDCSDLIQLLDTYVTSKTNVHILSEKPIDDRNSMRALACQEPLSQISITDHVGDRTSAFALAKLPLWDASAILVLAESEDCNKKRLNATTSDTECLACVVTITGLCEGRHGKKHARPLKGHIVCEVLDARSERLLLRNEHLSKMCLFFRSNLLETGMFAMAAADPLIFNVLSLLLTPNDIGELVLLPVSPYLTGHYDKPGFKAEDETCLPALPRTSGEVSFGDMQERIRGVDGSGGILIGWQQKNVAAPKLVPAADRQKLRSWEDGDQLLVLRRPESSHGL